MPATTLSNKETLDDLSLEHKIQFSKDVMQKSVSDFGTGSLGIAITGGKDSTLTLWLLRAVCRQLECALPTCMFIDEGDVFAEIYEFVRGLESRWELDVVWMKNEDVVGKARFLGDEIKVSELNEENRKELEIIGFEGDSFPFDPESYVGNHLMKTVPMKRFIVRQGIQGLMTAIRWDEQAARLEEDFFSPREIPPHTRIHPILHFRERDVWDSIHCHEIPFCGLYRQGYRSLGARSTTGKVSDTPAWEQDLEQTPERSGRDQDKEQTMEKLRELGYM